MHLSLSRFSHFAALLCLLALVATSSFFGQPTVTIEKPILSMTPVMNGAMIAQLTSATSGVTIHYTVDGSTPTLASEIYETPFLLTANLTIKAIAFDERTPNAPPPASAVMTRSPILNVPSGALVWSDEFGNDTGAPKQPNPAFWTFETGHNGYGNHELETYCAWGSTEAPCNPATPNAFVGEDGNLHIIARQTDPGVYTSARLKTAGHFSFQYGRVEFRARVPEGQGLWPAAWLLGNNISRVHWPACGEQDVLERVNAAKDPDWNEGSIHGVGFVGDKGIGTVVNLPKGDVAASWHTYGMIWSKGKVAYYIDDPKHPYVVDTLEDLKKFPGSIWPFDAGQSNFIILNLAVGGDWPGAPNASTQFPAEMLVDYVRVYTN
jgi:beta-glucanase (GH16 family)